jgi:hypothetical protein
MAPEVQEGSDWRLIFQRFTKNAGARAGVFVLENKTQGAG